MIFKKQCQNASKGLLQKTLSVMTHTLWALANASCACQIPVVTVRQSQPLGESPIWKETPFVQHPDVKQTNCLTIPQRTRTPKCLHLSIIPSPQNTFFVLQQFQPAQNGPNRFHGVCLALKRYYWLYLFVWFHMLPRQQSQIRLICTSYSPKANPSRSFLRVSSISLC